MIKIIAPVNDVYEAKAIVEAGADEIYCGVFPKSSKRQHGYAAFPNTRSPKGNLKSYTDLLEVVSIAHHNCVPVFLTLNGNGYTKKLYPMVFEQARQAKKSGVDALIVVDVGLLLSLKKEKIGIDIHMGTAGVSFNSQAVKFYEDLGASRIVLPRDLSLNEARGIIKDCPSVKFEAIILRSGCRYIDGFCWFSHHLKEIFGRTAEKKNGRLEQRGHFACELDYEVSFIGDKRARKAVKDIAFEPLITANACGVCRLSEFHKMGLYGVKIAGRGHSTGQKISDIRFVKNAHQQIFGADCKKSCYYPQ